MISRLRIFNYSMSLILLFFSQTISLWAQFELDPSLYDGNDESVNFSGEELPELIITASRQELSILEAPFTVHTISSNMINEKLPRSLPETLSQTPGVSVQKTSNGQGSPYIRGFTGYRTLAVVDGVRYNNSTYRDGPNEYFALLDQHTLDHIELLAGPASVLYGSDAIGGTLLLSTKDSGYLDEAAGEAFMHGSQSYRFSSAESSHVGRTEVEFGQGAEWGVRLGYSYADFGNVDAAKIGEQKRTGYSQDGFDLRFDLQLSDQWVLTFNHQNAAQDDVWRTHSTIYGVSYSGSSVGTDLKRVKDLQRSLNYLKLSGRNLEGFIHEADLTISYQTLSEESDRVRSSGTRELASFDSRMIGLDLQLSTETAIGDFVYGVDAYQDRVDSAQTDYNADGTIDQVRIQGPVGDDSKYLWLGAYAQGVFQLGDRYKLTASTRFTRNEAKIGRYEDPATGDAASYEDSWNSSVSSLRLSYDLDEAKTWLLWGGVSQSFRAPNIADLSRYGGSRSTETEVAATNLSPEHFLTYELGIKGEKDALDTSITVYYTQIDDYISTAPTGNIVGGLTEVTKRNSGSGSVFGVELTAAYDLLDQWSLRGNLTYLEGELETFVDASSFDTVNEPLSRVQPLTVNGALRYDDPYGKWWAELACTLVDRADKLSSGDESDTQRIPPSGTPGYALFSLYGGYEFNENLSITLGIENILDQAYRVHGSGSNEPGFGINAGLTAKF
ncbi:MAG: TonB-dependent receptor [Akkermansiaceae bacterium]